MTGDRTEALQAFLERAGWGDAKLTWRAGDASFRRYARLSLGDRSAMAMDAPPDKEAIKPFLQAGALLAKAGLRTPAVLAADEALGFLLLEDLGDATFTACLDGGAPSAPLYDQAVDALIALRRGIARRPAWLRDYDAERRVADLSTFTKFLLPEVGRPLSRDAAEAFDGVWLEALKNAPSLGQGVVHRDFHVDNLMLTANGTCALLDFQDAAWGPFAYDLASLVEDARRDMTPALKARCLARYQAAFPEHDAGEIAAALAVHGGQRHLRVAGLWVRLWRRDGKPGYLKHMRRTLDRLDVSLAQPALADVRALMQRIFPDDARAAALALAKAAA